MVTNGKIFGVEGFVPRSGLRNGHAQTIAGNFLPRVNLLPDPEERIFSVAPEVQVMCHCHWQPERQRNLTVFIVHGLEGSSNSEYVIGTGSKAWERGWNVVRMNIRGCGGTEQLCPTLYNSGLTGDIKAVISTLIEQDRLERIALAGFSMGGNQVLKCMGEWASGTPAEVLAAAVVSPSADLSPCADAIHRPINRIYEWWFLVGLMRRLKRKAALFPKKFNLKNLRLPGSIRAFDERVTARHFGFASAEDYYTRASASRVIDRIARPTLVIHSLDDPFVVLTPETERKLRTNPAITYVATEHGGHCAFLADANGYDGRWAELQIINFLAQIAAEKD